MPCFRTFVRGTAASISRPRRSPPYTRSSTSTTFWNVEHHARRKGFSYTSSWRCMHDSVFSEKRFQCHVCRLDLPTTFRELLRNLFYADHIFPSIWPASFVSASVTSSVLLLHYRYASWLTPERSAQQLYSKVARPTLVCLRAVNTTICSDGYRDWILVYVRTKYLVVMSFWIRLVFIL